MLIPALFLTMQSVTPGVFEPAPLDPRAVQEKSRQNAPLRTETPTPPPSQKNIPASEQDLRFDQCIALAGKDPVSGLVSANNWLGEGGGYAARHCLGFAYARQANWPLAITEFENAAREAASASDAPHSGNLWAQAGNAALASGQYLRAISFFDTAISGGGLTGQALGEAHLDKARALVALDKPEDARIEFAKVHELVPMDPLGWLLSATLARRSGDLQTAVSDITEAAKLVPQDPDIALEAGNIAVSSGDYKSARTNWQQAISIAGDGEAGKSAKVYLSQLDALENESGAAPTP